MKKSILFLNIFLLIISTIITSCKDDKDDIGENNSLVGTWQCIADYYQEGNEWIVDYVYKSEECIWVFDEKYLTVSDKNDMMDGQQVEYSYKDNTLIVLGVKRNVLKLTSSELEIDNSFMGHGAKSSFKKIK